jgi:predicted RNA-binding Zn-ribbon protein involved in translation (DUF1610 family)
MEINELIKLVHEYAGKGFSLNLSPNAVKKFSEYLEGAFRDSCPECGNKLWLKRHKPILGSTFYRLNCQCGWYGRVYELNEPHDL